MAIAPIGPFVRFVVTASAAVYANWDTIAGMFERAETAAAGPLYGQYVQHVFEFKDSAGSFSARERGMVGVHWLNTTGGDLDVTWTSADFALVETGFETMWTAITSKIGPDCRLVEHRWYPFGPGAVPPTPPSRVTTLATPKVGSSGFTGAHQICSTVTFRTPLRRHWGRMYIPYQGSGYNPGGVLSSTDVDTLANAANAYFKSGVANGLTPCVYDRIRKSCLGITAVEVDQIPDVIRRRRPRTTAYRKVLTA